MENKNVGWIIIGIASLVGLIIFIFNQGLRSIVEKTCSHGDSCTMYDTIAVQTWLSVSIALVIVIIGLVIMFSKPNEKIIVKTKKIKEKKKKLDVSGLNEKEKKQLIY